MDKLNLTSPSLDPPVSREPVDLLRSGPEKSLNRRCLFTFVKKTVCVGFDARMSLLLKYGCVFDYIVCKQGQRCTLNLSRAETSSRWCGVVVRRGCQLRCRPRHLTMVQNYVVRRQKPSCS
ncbi:uncharacterized protein TNCV_5067421 [Trichonephila clavipes]|nr:uncharacterized protein TNCV_5067421 [Trichonephila clavipes]